MSLLVRLVRSERAATAAEFAMVTPLMLLLLLGIVDVGRFAWELNRAEKATQMGARMAAVTSPVSPGLVEANFAGGAIKPGDLIPDDAMAPVICTSTGCTCTEAEGGPDCPLGDNANVAAEPFTNIVTRMQVFKPDVTAAHVQVKYSGSGFGFAGSPPTKSGGASTTETMEVSPLITVSLVGVPFTPVTTLLLSTFNLPTASTTVVAEDQSGIYSN